MSETERILAAVIMALVSLAVAVAALIGYVVVRATGKLDSDYERIKRNGFVDEDEDNDFSEIGYVDIKRKAEQDDQEKQ